MYFETYKKELSIRVIVKTTLLKLNIELPKTKEKESDKYFNIIFSLNDFSFISDELKFEKIPDKGFEVDALSLAIDSELLNNLHLCLKKNLNEFGNIKVYSELTQMIKEIKEQLGGK